MHTLQELVRLHRLEKPARTVARLLRIGPNTERKYREQLEGAGLLQGDPNELPELSLLLQATGGPTQPPRQPSSVEPWRPQIEQLLERGKRPRAIYDHLRRTDPQFTGTYPATKRLCRAIKKAAPVHPCRRRLRSEEF